MDARLLATLLLACCTLLSSSPVRADDAVAAPLTLIPMPAHVQRQQNMFVLNDGDGLHVQTDDPRAYDIAAYFAGLVARTRDLRLLAPPAPMSKAAPGTLKLSKLDLPKARSVSHAGPPDTSPIRFELSKSYGTELGTEGYRLQVSEDGINISAATPAGLFYGSVTLWQLLTPTAGRGPVAVIPDVSIEDQSRYGWRGLLLDSARHFQSVADIEQLIDWMALHKLNVLQWHLTDDQGWRLQIKKYPKLTRIGACRKSIGPDAVLSGGPDKPYCGSYTQDQAREIVRYAAARYVTVVPEIEMPGHAQAAIAAYPEFGVTGQQPAVSTDWGVHAYLYNTDAAALGFLQEVLDEVMAVFPSTYIDLGGDEALKDQWKASAAIQAQMRGLKLADEDALQGWFITHMAEYLQAHGRKLIGWDGILTPGLPPQAAVMAWQNPDYTAQALQQGHDVVIAYSPTLYMDDYQSDAHDEPPGRPPVVSLKDVYGFEPAPVPTGKPGAGQVLGEQINLWTEYMPTFARDEHALFPRMAAFAEAAWSPAAARDWDGFLARLPAELTRYHALGIGYADSTYAPRFALSPEGDSKISVSLSNQVGGVIRYAIGDTAVTAASPLYSTPLTMTPPAELTATAFATDGSPLATRHAHIDAAALTTRDSDALDTCSNKLVLRIEAPRPLTGTRPVYRVDIMDTCWLWRAAAVDGMRHLSVGIGKLPWNYQLAHDVSGVVVRPTDGSYPALDVHLDSCGGQTLAHLPLQAAEIQTQLTAQLPAFSGSHDLCFIVTGDPKQGLWAIDKVLLSP